MASCRLPSQRRVQAVALSIHVSKKTDLSFWCACGLYGQTNSITFRNSSPSHSDSCFYRPHIPHPVQTANEDPQHTDHFINLFFKIDITSS